MNSVVIPCYRSADSLPALARELIDLLRPRGPCEIVLVNDGSPDGGATWEAIAALEERYPGEVAGVNLALNFGEHSAVLAGLELARGEKIVIMDDDGQNPPAEALKLLDGLAGDDVDVVYGAYAAKRHSLLRNLGSRANGWMAGLLMGKPSGLYLCSFKALNRKLVERIIQYPGCYPYIDGLVFRNTRRFKVVPVEHCPRAIGRSTYSWSKLLRLYANMAFGFSIWPLRVVTLLGFACAVLALFSAIYFIIDYYRTETPVEGWTSTAVLITFFSGMILFALGILGEYLGRMYLAATGRRRFIIDEVRRRPPSQL